MGKSAINPAVVGKHSTDIAALKNDLGIVEDGDTATHTIAQGQYVIWQGALYTADAAIASGITLAASGGNKNLTAVENGGLNAINSKINVVQIPISNITIHIGSINEQYIGYKTANVVEIRLIITNVTANSGSLIAELLSSYPLMNIYLPIYDYNSGKLINGSIYFNNVGVMTYYGDTISNKTIMIHGCYVV